MSIHLGPSRERESRERAIRSLSACTGETLADVRALFDPEFARLKMGAKVGSYLTVLTASSVRAMLRRKARRAAETPEGSR